jgi:hypothetical protein
MQNNSNNSYISIFGGDINSSRIARNAAGRRLSLVLTAWPVTPVAFGARMIL